MKVQFDKGKNFNFESDKTIKIKYKRVFFNEEGKFVLDHLAEKANMYRTNYVQNDPGTSAFLEGQRAMFLYICSFLDENNDNLENIKGAKDYE